MKNIFLVASLFIAQFSLAQLATDSKVFLELKEMDKLFFDEGFNKCNIQAFTPFISEDVEFYHDKGGITLGKEALVQSIKQNICGNKEIKPIRKLVEGTLEVHPLYSKNTLYGAIQSGVHEFYIQEPNKELYKTGIAKFTHLWLKTENNTWTLKRVLSYDHQ